MDVLFNALPEPIWQGWWLHATRFARMTLIPSSPGLYVIIVLCVLGSVAVYLVMRQRLPLKLQRFEGRERLPIEQIHDRFYPRYEMGRFIELWKEIASAVEVPPELIRPTDRFDGELGPVKGFEVASEMDDLVEAFMRRCKQQQLDFRRVNVKTVDDYIKQFIPLPNP
jgi:hypothetical protein